MFPGTMHEHVHISLASDSLWVAFGRDIARFAAFAFCFDEIWLADRSLLMRRAGLWCTLILWNMISRTISALPCKAISEQRILLVITLVQMREAMIAYFDCTDDGKRDYCSTTLSMELLVSGADDEHD